MELNRQKKIIWRTLKMLYLTTSIHRRIIKTEENAKVVADAWGTELIEFHAAVAIFHQDALKKRTNRVRATCFLESAGSHHTKPPPSTVTRWLKIMQHFLAIFYPHFLPNVAQRGLKRFCFIFFRGSLDRKYNFCVDNLVLLMNISFPSPLKCTKQICFCTYFAELFSLKLDWKPRWPGNSVAFWKKLFFKSSLLLIG